jgi:hypothetical protein
MKISLLPALLIVMISLSPFAVPAAIAASPEALPPPEHGGSPPPAADVGGDNNAGMKKELSPPSTQKGVVIRSFKRSDGAEITEYRMHGRTYMIKVQPANGMPAYYLYDSNGDGQFDRRLPGGYKLMSPPTWVIKRF